MKRPATWYTRDPNPGSFRVTIECCEIEERKTVHFDAFDSGKLPCGHLGTSQIAVLIEHLKKCQRWLEAK